MSRDQWPPLDRAMDAGGPLCGCDECEQVRQDTGVDELTDRLREFHRKAAGSVSTTPDPDDPPALGLIEAIHDALDQAWARFEDTGGLTDHGTEVAAAAAWRWFAALVGNTAEPEGDARRP